jgi:hypothetical protein
MSFGLFACGPHPLVWTAKKMNHRSHRGNSTRSNPHDGVPRAAVEAKRAWLRREISDRDFIISQVDRVRLSQLIE